MTDSDIARVVQENAEAISGCAIFTVIHNENISREVLPVIQMGLAVYLDKPIVILCPESRRDSIPNNVRRMAIAIDYYDDTLRDPGEREMSLQAATFRLMDAASRSAGDYESL